MRGWSVLNSTGSLKVQGSTGATGPTGPTGPAFSNTTYVSTQTSTILTSGASYTGVGGLSGSITPSSASNRIRIQAVPNLAFRYAGSGGIPAGSFQIRRTNATGTVVATFLSVMAADNLTLVSAPLYLDCIDSPATTGAQVYVVLGKYSGNATIHDVNTSGAADGLPTSYLTLTEVI